jgi:hypothetical protein
MQTNQQQAACRVLDTRMPTFNTVRGFLSSSAGKTWMEGEVPETFPSGV